MPKGYALARCTRSFCWRSVTIISQAKTHGSLKTLRDSLWKNLMFGELLAGSSICTLIVGPCGQGLDGSTCLGYVMVISELFGEPKDL